MLLIQMSITIKTLAIFYILDWVGTNDSLALVPSLDDDPYTFSHVEPSND